MRMLVTNCPNCGGVLNEGKCPYCDTQVRFANELDIKANDISRSRVQISLNVKRGNETIIFPFVGYLHEINIDHSDCFRHYDSGASIKTVRCSYPSARLVFEGTLTGLGE